MKPYKLHILRNVEIAALKALGQRSFLIDVFDPKSSFCEFCSKHMKALCIEKFCLKRLVYTDYYVYN